MKYLCPKDGRLYEPHELSDLYKSVGSECERNEFCSCKRVVKTGGAS